MNYPIINYLCEQLELTVNEDAQRVMNMMNASVIESYPRTFVLQSPASLQTQEIVKVISEFYEKDDFKCRVAVSAPATAGLEAVKGSTVLTICLLNFTSRDTGGQLTISVADMSQVANRKNN